MKAFVTGGTGFIGSHLVEALVQKGYDVTCLVRRTSDLRWLKSLSISYVEGDLRDEEMLKRGFEGQDYIFHVAGLTKAIYPEEYDQVNHQGTRNLIRAALESNMAVERFVYFSSLAAVGPSPSPEPINDSIDPHPVNSYGRSKLEAEEFLIRNSENLPITIIRPPTVYGPRDRDFYLFFRYAQKGWIPLLWNGDPLLSLVYVKDLVRAVFMALETPETIGKVYFVSDRFPYAWSKIVETIASALQIRPLPIRIPISFLYLASLGAEGLSRIRKRNPLLTREKVREIREKYWICYPTKAQDDFGYKSLFSLEEGIAETLQWYLENGWL